MVLETQKIFSMPKTIVSESEKMFSANEKIFSAIEKIFYMIMTVLYATEKIFLIIEKIFSLTNTTVKIERSYKSFRINRWISPATIVAMIEKIFSATLNIV